jgi:hypothetical protein
MVMVTGKVVDGKVVVDGDPPPEGAEVTAFLSQSKRYRGRRSDEQPESA